MTLRAEGRRIRAAAVRRRRRADRRQDPDRTPDGVESRSSSTSGTARRIVWAQRAGLDGRLPVGRALGRDRRSAPRSWAITLVHQGVPAKLGDVSGRSSRHGHLTDDDVAYMGDDVLDLPVLSPRRPVGGAGRRRRRCPVAGRLGQRARRRRRRGPRARRTGPARAAPLGGGRCARYLAEGSQAMSAYAPLLAALVAPARRPDDRQGVGALQAARRPLVRSPPGARVATLHPRASTSSSPTRSISRSRS